MKKLLLPLAAFALVAVFNPHHASALSSVTSDARDSDGSPAFADPDEKKPAFMLSGGGGNGSQSAPASSNGFAGVTLPSVGNATPGAQAFDRAYAHQSGQ